MTKDEAKKRFCEIVSLYGLQWNATVPPSLYYEMAELSKILTLEEKRAALGLRC